MMIAPSVIVRKTHLLDTVAYGDHIHLFDTFFTKTINSPYVSQLRVSGPHSANRSGRGGFALTISPNHGINVMVARKWLSSGLASHHIDGPTPSLISANAETKSVHDSRSEK
jgi:hypothetical protein